MDSVVENSLWPSQCAPRRTGGVHQLGLSISFQRGRLGRQRRKILGLLDRWPRRAGKHEYPRRRRRTIGGRRLPDDTPGAGQTAPQPLLVSESAFHPPIPPRTLAVEFSLNGNAGFGPAVGRIGNPSYNFKHQPIAQPNVCIRARFHSEKPHGPFRYFSPDSRDGSDGTGRRIPWWPGNPSRFGPRSD